MVSKLEMSTKSTRKEPQIKKRIEKKLTVMMLIMEISKIERSLFVPPDASLEKFCNFRIIYCVFPNDVSIPMDLKARALNK